MKQIITAAAIAMAATTAHAETFAKCVATEAIDMSGIAITDAQTVEMMVIEQYAMEFESNIKLIMAQLNVDMPGALDLLMNHMTSNGTLDANTMQIIIAARMCGDQFKG